MICYENFEGETKFYSVSPIRIFNKTLSKEKKVNFLRCYCYDSKSLKDFLISNIINYSLGDIRFILKRQNENKKKA